MKAFALASVLTCLAAMSPAFSAEGIDLVVTAQPLRSAQGQLVYSVYNSAESWNSEHEDEKGQLEAIKGAVTFTIHDLKPGTYAVAVFHDENSNGKHDTDFLGRPTEMFGISNITRTLWSRPEWDEIKIEVKAGQENKLPILLKWQ